MAFEVEAGSESRRNVNRTTDPVSARRYCGSRSNSSLFEFELIVLENSSWASRRSNNRACSTGLSACSTLVILPFGVALAWLLARGHWPGKSILETVIALPLVLPPVATGLLLLKLLGRRGVIGGFLHDSLGIDVVFTWRAVLIALG